MAQAAKQTIDKIGTCQEQVLSCAIYRDYRTRYVAFSERCPNGMMKSFPYAVAKAGLFRGS
jgi:hypothetical protein